MKKIVVMIVNVLLLVMVGVLFEEFDGWGVVEIGMCYVF